MKREYGEAYSSVAETVAAPATVSVFHSKTELGNERDPGYLPHFNNPNVCRVRRTGDEYEEFKHGLLALLVYVGWFHFQFFIFGLGPALGTSHRAIG